MKFELMTRWQIDHKLEDVWRGFASLRRVPYADWLARGGWSPRRAVVELGTNFAHESHEYHEWGRGKGVFIRAIREIRGQPNLAPVMSGQDSQCAFVCRAFSRFVRLALPLFPKA